MRWLAVFGWVLKCVFTCNHLRTPVNEGKCYCPDCGAGVIFRWVVLRCGECHLRRDSRYWLRQVVPEQRCCAYCGSARYGAEALESPSYFQLYKARLQIEEPQDAGQAALWCRMGWVMETAWETVGQAMSYTRAWLEPSVDSPRVPAVALIPVSSH